MSIWTEFVPNYIHFPVQVFFYLHPYVIRPWFLPFQWKSNDTSDESARRAFESILFVTADVYSMANLVSATDKREIRRSMRDYKEAALEDDVRLIYFP